MLSTNQEWNTCVLLEISSKVTILFEVPDSSELTTLNSSFLSGPAIPVSPTVNASNMLTCFEGLSSYLQLNLISIESVNAESAYTGDVCAGGNDAGSALIKAACTRSVCSVEYSEIYSQVFQILELGDARLKIQVGIS